MYQTGEGEAQPSLDDAPGQRGNDVMSSNPKIPAHAQSIAACTEAFAVDVAQGLTSQLAQERRDQHGANRLVTGGHASWWQIFLRQFTSALIVILLVAAAVAASVGSLGDALTILAIVLLNGILGFIQEWRAERAIEALRDMLSPKAQVVRDGHPRLIDAVDLVPGDVVMLHTGDRVPADLRLVTATDVQAEEAALTGESSSVAKSTAAVEPEAPLADRAGMAFMGTTIVNGRATGIVTGTGMQTELGKIAQMTRTIAREPTPLERKLAGLGRQLGLAAIAVSTAIAVLGWLTGRPLFEMLMTGVSLAVAVVPEGLPAVVTITLALGVTAMARRKALLRHLQAAETLGAVDVICTDKTGTLTRNEMAVTRVWLPSGVLEITGEGYGPDGAILKNGEPATSTTRRAMRRLAKVAALCNNAELLQNENGRWTKLGEATEAALLTLAGKAGFVIARDRGPKRIAEFSFNSRRKRMTVVIAPQDGAPGERQALTKGAPEVLRERFAHVCDGEALRPFDDAARAAFDTAFHQIADAGLRALALAERTLDHDTPLDADTVEKDLVLLGLVGIIDPPRMEVPAAIEEAERAGISVVMITGDAAPTAAAIASAVGLPSARVLTGPELDKITDDELSAAIDAGAVFARVAPEHKVRIVQVLQKRGLRVAMTGDGVNDAPALKQSNVGIAMGIRGTDVARGVADMVLTDDNFASIVAAVREGRRQYQNIQKFVSYLLSSNSAEVLAICAAILIGGPLILLPVQILWMNLVTDGPTALALGLEREDPDIMDAPPRPPREPILNETRLRLVLWTSAYIALATLALFWWCGAQNTQTLAYAQTMAFTGMIVLEKVNVFNFRSLQRPAIDRAFNAPQNNWLWIAVAGSLMLQVAAVYVPPLQVALHTVPLDLIDWLALLVVALPVLVVGWWAKPRAAAGAVEPITRRGATAT